MKKFSKSQTITKSNLENVPGNKPGVYRIKNTQGEILYIGRAKGARLPDRIMEHKGEITGGTKFQFRVTSSKEGAIKLEQQEIKKYRPIVNKEV